MEFKEFIIKIREVISKGFCHKYYAVNEFGNPIDVFHPEAKCWCLVGSGWLVSANNKIDYVALRSRFYELIQEKTGKLILQFNDSSSKEEVLALLDDILKEI